MTRRQWIATATMALGVSSGWLAIYLRTAGGLNGYKTDDVLTGQLGAAVGTGKAVVLLVSQTCSACVATTPFLKKLSASANTARVVVAGYESVEDLQTFVNSYQIRADRVVSLKADLIRDGRRLEYPAVVFVEAGVVRDVSVGRPSVPEQETRLIERAMGSRVGSR